VKVLYISSGPGQGPAWVAADGQGVELLHEGSIARGAERLADERVDAVVVDAGADGAEGGGLRRLQAVTRGAALLVVGDPEANGTGAASVGLADEVADGVVPRDAEPAVQAALVRATVERLRLAGELARSEGRFRDVIERNADAIVVVDREGVVQFANAMAGELFGCAPGELLGTPFGYPMIVGESTEVDVVRRGGPPLVVELRVVESEWEGRGACIISLRDITERKRSEEHQRRLLREQVARSAAEVAARRFRFLADAATVLSASLEYEKTLGALARLCVTEIADWALVYIVDDRGAVHRLEVAHRDESKLPLVRELRESPIEPGGPHPVLPVLERGRPLLVERVDDEELNRIADNPRHLELLRELGVSSFMLVPLIARGRGLGAIGLVCADPERSFGEQDLALAENLASRAALAVDNARLYREAQEATRAKTDLLTIISHDLRTPLTSIIGYAELLIMGVPEPLSDGTRERVERMRAGAEHLLHLINQLLALSRLDAGREEVRPEDIDVADVVRDVAVVVEPLASERQLAFAVDLPGGAMPLRTDPGKLRQVLVNLAANAIKFTERGEVRVEVRQPDATGTVIRVIDTGPGIAPEHLDRIFEPFWQVEAGPKDRMDGTGLGLSVVSRLVELLGGGITVESVVGEGSTFAVTLPAEPPAGRA
jgi:signal transduction histidine kinase/PAS domain-containing protein